MSLAWQTKALAEICKIKPPKGEAREKLSDSDLVSFVPMEDLGIGQKFLEPRVERKLNQVAGGYTYFADGDVLLAKITPCFENGKLGIARGLTNTIGFGSSEYLVFRPSESLSSEYLYYFLSQHAFRTEGERTMSGAVGHKRVSKEFIERLTIPLPPLPEQRRIVAILDEAFVGLATATANAKKNLKNARALFDSCLREKMGRRDGWKKCPLEQVVAKTQIGLVKSLREQGPDKPFPYVKMNNISRDNQFDESIMARVLALPKEVNVFSLRRGDFLFNTRNSRELVGKSCIYESSDSTPTLFNNNIMRLQFKPELQAKFCAYFFQLDSTKAQLEAIKSGTTNVAAIYWNKFKILIVEYPNISTQTKIVESFEAISSEILSLTATYADKLQNIETLRQALLQKAFSGELTSPPSQAIGEAAE